MLVIYPAKFSGNGNKIICSYSVLDVSIQLSCLLGALTEISTRPIKVNFLHHCFHYLASIKWDEIMHN